ncbi:uncharacterized protein LOC126473858 [Schistocerca serialis cubense]|uniref:uncharacterized protein LOC126473858 n=1 Tax=Schistocerca serialis cubense TaxID=2023355 RepID=UPI00214E3980|nr:uncharacterized protein LOC126473858 [Schistocerca serialis cubense]
MATIKLDDLLGKKKEAPQVLDLSRSVVQSKEDMRKLMDRVPEYKIRPEKVRHEDIRMREKDFTFRPQRREFRRQGEYSYANPVPPDMRSVALEDLSPVPIDWKMLTSVRPRSKVDEELFSRLVLLGKLHLYTAAQESQNKPENLINRVKNRAGILDSRPPVCLECLDEFCDGTACQDFLYDSFFRCDINKDEEDVMKLNGNSASRSKSQGKKHRGQKGKAMGTGTGKRWKKGKKRRKKSKTNNTEEKE